MELKLIDGMPDFTLVVDLIRLQWQELGDSKTDEELVKISTDHHDLQADWTKFLYSENRIIGYYRCGRWPRNEKSSRVAHLFDIAVDQKHQKRGLGTMLLDDVKKECRKRGYTKIMSRIMESNIASRRLHEKSGFALAFRKDDSMVWEFDIADR